MQALGLKKSCDRIQEITIAVMKASGLCGDEQLAGLVSF